MAKGKKRRRSLAFTGVAALVAVAVNLLITAINSQRKQKKKGDLGIPLFEGTKPASCFVRLVIGYEATFYRRLWSEVFSANIFASKFQDHLPNQSLGMQFQDKVLASGGSRDSMEILTDFLGRRPLNQSIY